MHGFRIVIEYNRTNIAVCMYSNITVRSSNGYLPAGNNILVPVWPFVYMGIYTLGTTILIYAVVYYHCTTILYYGPLLQYLYCTIPHDAYQLLSKHKTTYAWEL